MALSLFIYLLLSLIVLISKNKYLSIIACIIFGIFIFFIRDIDAPPDSLSYIKFFDDEDIMGTSIGFKSYKYILKNILFLPSSIAFHFTTIFPFLVVSYISIRSKILSPIFFFISSEAFPVLSFNAIRQGIGISFLILSMYYFIQSINEEEKIKRYRLIIFGIFLIGIATIHSTMFGFYLLFLFFLIFNIFIKSFLEIFIKFKVKKFLLKNLTIILSVFLISILITYTSKSIFINKGIAQLSNNVTYSKTGYFGSIYRITVMSILLIYPYLRKNFFKIKNSLNHLRENTPLFISYLGISSTIVFAPFAAQIFIRFSYFYIVPIIYSFIYWNKYNRSLIENSTLTKIFITGIGLITYSSGAIENILYK